MRKFRVLVVGAMGGVGLGITRALLGQDASLDRLYASSRDAARLTRFHESIGMSETFVPVVGSVDTHEHARLVRDAVLACGPLDAVIASLGGWWEGAPLVEIEEATMQSVFDSLLKPHVICAQTFVPALETAGTTYLFIGGGAARTPVPGSSLVSIAGAAQLMFARSLVAERRDAVGPKITELLIDGPIATEARHHGPVTRGEITAFEVGRAVAEFVLHDDARSEPRFDWPRPLLSHDGPVTIMHPRGTTFADRTMSDDEVRVLADAVVNDSGNPTLRMEASETMLHTIEYRPGDAWAVVLRLIEIAQSSDAVEDIAWGELASLLTTNGPAVIDAIEASARADARVARALGRVFRKDLEPILARRVRDAAAGE